MGETKDGSSLASISGVIRLSVMRVPATGARALTKMLYFWPSSRSAFMKPTTASLAPP